MALLGWRKGVCIIMTTKFNFVVDERVTFFWRFKEKDDLTKRQGRVSEIDETGIWMDFDDDKESDNFIPYEDMHFFIRDGSNIPEGTLAGDIIKITGKHFGLQKL